VQTGLKLARYFGTSDKFFIKLQADVDIREEKQKIWAELEQIKHFHA
jgi:plasmid maintenance system antidote protein VapI